MFLRTAAEFEEHGKRFQHRLAEVKRSNEVPDYGWYPYESLAALPIISELLMDEFDNVASLLSAEPIADIGCGDGDFAALFAHLGVEVDAIDHAETNFNQMRGVQVLKRILATDTVRFSHFDIDLDKCFELPRTRYGLILFLGTLYHLKNPFYILETLARKTAYCILSTRIAQETFKTAVPIESEPVAYLLNARGASNDPTNFWIFSEAGLLRLLTRTGWMVRAQKKVGCLCTRIPSNLKPINGFLCC